MIEADWIPDGTVGEGKNKRKTYQCKICRKKGVRRNHRNVHSCI